jgi:hypothetical protein
MLHREGDVWIGKGRKNLDLKITFRERWEWFVLERGDV